MFVIRQTQLEVLDVKMKASLVEGWATGVEPMTDPTWDRLKLARQTMMLAETYAIEGPKAQTELHQLLLRHGPTFPQGEPFRRYRMILAALDFSFTYRMEQVHLLEAPGE